MGAKLYPAYKDSGVEWIGEIPEHWEVKRLKHHGRIFNGRDYKNHENPVGKYPVYGSGGEFTRGDDYLCAVPSLLLGRKGTVNRPLLVTDPFWTVDTMYYCVPSNTTNLSWLYYYATRIPFDQLTYGSALPSMSQSQYYLLPIPSPPLEEQKQIAAFLDRETYKIDTLIEKQQHLINLLKEKRGSLISHTVTKGLNPNVPMKDSGVEWIGEIPEHWDVKRLKDVADCRLSNVDKHTVDGEPAVVLCNYVDVYKNDFITADISFMAATASAIQVSRLSIHIDDVLMTKDSESPDDIGVPALVRSVVPSLVCGYHLALIRTNSHTQDGGYTFRFLSSKSATSQFYTMAKGITRYAIGKGEISRLLLPSPPLEEQKQIAAFLDRETSKFDTLIDKANQSIALLKERRSSLISAAVTGKIDVREAA